MKKNKTQKKKLNYDAIFHNSIIIANTLQQELQNCPAWGMGRPHHIKGHTFFTPCLDYPPLFSNILDRTIAVLPCNLMGVAK